MRNGYTEARFEQLKEMLTGLAAEEGDILTLMHDAVANWTPTDTPLTLGRVLRVGDGVATVTGLPDAFYGEILVFQSGVRGMVQELSPDGVGCILFGDDRSVGEGSAVKRTGKVAGIPVGEDFVGRVVDALGTPIDGKGRIHADGYLPVESPENAASELIALREVIALLDDRDREMISLRYYRGMTQSRTAELLGMSQVQVSRREKAVLALLRRNLSA